MTVEELARALGPLAERDAPLGALTTFRIGGPAALLVRAKNLEDLHTVAHALSEAREEVLVVGKGSNLLVADSGFPGLAIVLGGEFQELSIDASTLTAGGALSLPVVARRSAAVGLTGLEWAVGVPGSVGGAVMMNAGGHGSQMNEVLIGAEILDLVSGGDAQPRWRKPDELGLDYRHSNLSSHEVVLRARLELRVGERRQAEKEIADVVAWRRAHQPGGQNCGSVFVNPPGDSAGRLIQEAGLRGHRLGTASVSEKHANFFQADPGGTAADMRALIAYVRETVRTSSGRSLRTEVKMVGF